MFGKQATAAAEAVALKPEQIMATTTATLPWAWRPLGVVLKEGQHFFRAGATGRVSELQKEAAKLGAKAVIGIQVGMNMSGGSGTSRVWAIGAAVTWDEQ